MRPDKGRSARTLTRTHKHNTFNPSTSHTHACTYTLLCRICAECRRRPEHATHVSTEEHACVCKHVCETQRFRRGWVHLERKVCVHIAYYAHCLTVQQPHCKQTFFTGTCVGIVYVCVCVRVCVCVCVSTSVHTCAFV